MTEVVYPPLDTMKRVDDDLWIVDSGPLRVAGMPLPVRMTVIRLADGSLLLHSPTRFEEDLKSALEQTGPIVYLVAPASGHWRFVKQWQARCPEAQCWAAPGLGRRFVVAASRLRIDHELGDAVPEPWRGDIELAVVPGVGFVEVAFFHLASRTLVLTDLIVNVEPEKLPAAMALGARLVGAAAPRGKAPLYLRLALRVRRKAAREAVERIVAWQPERVIFAHGQWFERNAAARLRESFSWLLS